MDRTKFEEIAGEVFDNLPKIFSDKIDNIHIVIEDYPTDEILSQTKSNKNQLLGLYQGIPLSHRGSWYGANPTVPDKITLFQRNIESISKNNNEIIQNIRDVLLHELGHYFGMSESEIRKAMENY